MSNDAGKLLGWRKGFGWIDRMKVLRFQAAKWQMEEMGKILKEES